MKCRSYYVNDENQVTFNACNTRNQQNNIEMQLRSSNAQLRALSVESKANLIVQQQINKTLIYQLTCKDKEIQNLKQQLKDAKQKQIFENYNDCCQLTNGRKQQSLSLNGKFRKSEKQLLLSQQLDHQNDIISSLNEEKEKLNIELGNLQNVLTSSLTKNSLMKQSGYYGFKFEEQIEKEDFCCQVNSTITRGDSETMTVGNQWLRDNVAQTTDDWKREIQYVLQYNRQEIAQVKQDLLQLRPTGIYIEQAGALMRQLQEQMAQQQQTIDYQYALLAKLGKSRNPSQ